MKSQIKQVNNLDNNWLHNNKYSDFEQFMDKNNRYDKLSLNKLFIKNKNQFKFNLYKSLNKKKINHMIYFNIWNFYSEQYFN